MQQCIKILVINPKIPICQNLLLTNMFYKINLITYAPVLYVEL